MPEMKQGFKGYDLVREAFHKVGTKGHEGLPLTDWDRDTFESAYKNFTFYLLPHHICGMCLYAVWDPESEETPFWETFASLDGELRHWLHFTAPVMATPEKECDNYCLQKEKSDDKPDETVGIPWYAYRIPGMIPWRMEQAMRKK